MKVRNFGIAIVLCAISAIANAASDAASQARALYTAIHKQDWHALYYLASFSPAIKKQLEGPDKFAADVKSGIDQGGNTKVVNDLFNSIRNIKVGAPAVKGTKATVPTSADITVNGRTLHFNGFAKMINDGGTWKWDLSYTDDVEKATANSLQQLIGKPAKG